MLCGCIGIVFTLNSTTNEQLVYAAYFVWIACVFDFFDGFAARALNVSSPIGKELDSLADMVSFGLLPAMVMFTMLDGPYLRYMAFSIAVFSALRLAIFNLDETQRDSFKGLPTPANALFITSLPLIGGDLAFAFFDPWILSVIVIVSSYLLVSGIPLFALKFKNFSWKDNKVRFIFLAIAVLLPVTFLLLAIQVVLAIPIVILLYIALSLGVQAVSK